MEDWLSIYVEDVSDVFGSRTYTVSGYDGTGDSPFDTLQFDTKKEAVSFAREIRRAEKEAIARQILTGESSWRAPTGLSSGTPVQWISPLETLKAREVCIGGMQLEAVIVPAVERARVVARARMRVGS